ncbi:MAG: hypothetical protein AAFZ11_04220 [Pseudomonadota bacterium]
MNPSVFDRLVAAQKHIASQGWVYIAAYVLLGSLPYIYLDLNMPEANGAYVLMSFVGIGLNFVLLYTLMLRSGLLESGAKAGIVTFFGLSILHSVGVAFGFLLLVLPGIYLTLRWLPAFARLLSSDDTIPAALAWSWHRTSANVGALGLAGVAPGLLWLACTAAMLAPELYYELYPNAPWETAYMSSVVIGNISLSVFFVWYTVLGIAAFAVLRDQVSDDTAAFE